MEGVVLSNDGTQWIYSDLTDGCCLLLIDYWFLGQQDIRRELFAHLLTNINKIDSYNRWSYADLVKRGKKLRPKKLFSSKKTRIYLFFRSLISRWYLPKRLFWMKKDAFFSFKKSNAPFAPRTSSSSKDSLSNSYSGPFSLVRNLNFLAIWAFDKVKIKKTCLWGQKHWQNWENE